MKFDYDVIVVGAGHAGCEAAGGPGGPGVWGAAPPPATSAALRGIVSPPVFVFYG